MAPPANSSSGLRPRVEANGSRGAASAGRTVLVTDGEQRAALAVVRSLCSAGHRVYVASAVPQSLAGVSRRAAGAVLTADPLADPAGYVESLRAAAEVRGVDTIFPITDVSMRAVLAARDAFETLGVAVPFATRAQHEAISDKASVLMRARELGISVPAQIVLPGSDWASAELDGLSYPVVVKPSRSVVSSGQGQLKTSVRYAHDRLELEAALRRLADEAYPVLLQERIPGVGVGVFLLRWNGRVAACFAHRRLREKPPSGGVSVLRESLPLTPALLEKSQRLLEAYDWAGPAMVEYLVTDAGEPYLMEVNGRYWGSLQLAIDAGVDFPALHLDLAAGVSRTPVLEYRAGVCTRWFMGDVDHLLARLRRTRQELSLPETAPGKGRVLLDFLRALHPRVRTEIWRFSDPLPALIEIARWVRRR